MVGFSINPVWRGGLGFGSHLCWTHLRGWITSRRDGSGALSVTVSAPVVTETRDEAGALHLTIQEPQ